MLEIHNMEIYIFLNLLKKTATRVYKHKSQLNCNKGISG